MRDALSYLQRVYPIFNVSYYVTIGFIYINLTLHETKLIATLAYAIRHNRGLFAPSGGS